MSSPALSPRTPPPFQTSVLVEFVPASTAKRIVAFILDMLMFAAVQTLVNILLKLLKLDPLASAGVGFLILSVLSFVYWVTLVQKMGATPGKLIMGLRVVTDRHDLHLTTGQLCLRELVGRWISTLPLLLGYFWSFFTKEKVTFHDLMARTRVVEYR